jgi:hypothetical protein
MSTIDVIETRLNNYLSRCRAYLVGDGCVQAAPSNAGTRFLVPQTSASHYSDAQLDDYTGSRRQDYANRPPLSLSLRARFSHPGWPLTSPEQSEPARYFTGTAGFGFWNSPVMAPSPIPARPQAIWFFYGSPPSNMPFALDVPGRGWKAACADAGRNRSLVWAPLLPFIAVANRWLRLYRLIWPHVQRSFAIGEKLISFQFDDMTAWHRYELEWRTDGASWWVDGEKVLETDRSPRGPLGFVAWVDNQYTILTPQGHVEFGHLDIPFAEWMDIDDVELRRFDRRRLAPRRRRERVAPVMGEARAASVHEISQ